MAQLVTARSVTTSLDCTEGHRINYRVYLTCIRKDAWFHPPVLVPATSTNEFLQQLLHHTSTQVRVVSISYSISLIFNSYVTTDPEDTDPLTPISSTQDEPPLPADHAETRVSYSVGDAANSRVVVDVDLRPSVRYDSNVRLVPNRRPISTV